MNVDVTVNGRPWKVALEPAEEPGQFHVIVKGRRRSVDAVWVDSDTLSVLDGAMVREIGVRRIGSGEMDVLLDGKTFRAVVSAPVRLKPDPTVVDPPPGDARSNQPKRDRVAPEPPSGRHTIVAPMPGRIVRVLVAVGDRVVARQGVVVVEAMKMENELRSPRDGIVKEVTVREGAAIEAGTVVVVIE